MLTVFEVLKKLGLSGASRDESVLIAYFIGRCSHDAADGLDVFDPLDFKRMMPAWYDRCRHLGLL